MNFRNKLLLVVFLGTISISFGQYDSKGENKSRFKPGAGWFFKGWRPSPNSPARKYDRVIFDINYCDWIGSSVEPFKVSPASIGFNVNFMSDKPLNQKSTVALGYGIRYERAHYRINSYLAGKNALVFNQPSNASKYGLNYNQFSIPLEIRFRNEAWRHFKFYVGGSVGYIVTSNTKLTLSSKTDETEIKTRKLSAVEPIQYGAHFRIGFRNWALYGAYNFSNLFTSASGLQANTLRLGLSISLF